MKTSDSINELATALSKAQGQMGGAKKDSANPFFKSSYADLASVVEAIKKPFADNGLSYVQGAGFDTETEYVCITTRLMHMTGQWVEEELRMKPTKADPQGIGSTITYGRRYGLQSIAGLPAEDDDGNAASQPQKPGRAAAAGPQATEARDNTAPLGNEKADALATLSNTLALLYRSHPDVMAYGPSDRTAKADAARKALLSQVLGEDVTDIRGLSIMDINQASEKIKELWP